MRLQFKDTMADLFKKDDRIVLLLGDISVFMFKDLFAAYPERIYNVGICENAIMSMAAGLSSQGFRPFVHTIAPFITERSYEQIKLDVCYNRFPVNIVSCGGSFDYAWDGATHHCYTDLEILRLLPGMEVMQPGTKREFDDLIRMRYSKGNPAYYRIAADDHNERFDIEYGKGVEIKNAGSKLTVVTAGPLLRNVLDACKDLSVNILYFHTIKPMDMELLAKFRNTKMLIIHDAYGLHEAVSECPDIRMERHGMPDKFCCYYGKLNEIRRELELDVDGIRRKVLRCLDAEGIK